MRKLKILALLLFTNIAFSQIDYAFVIEDSNGNQIEDQTTLEFSTVEYPDASFNFFIRNLTSEEINLRAEVLSISGSDGSNLEFCFGECYFGINTNEFYPLSSFITISPGETQTSVGDHIYNLDPGNGENPIEYSFRFFMVDDNGDEVVSIPELQTDYRINYYYSSSLTISEPNINNLNYYFKNNYLFIDSDNELNLFFYDFNGRKISQRFINEINNSVNILSLRKKYIIMYIVDTNGNIYSRKIIIP
tara:strand:- start:324 stop:1067 length:744 start_codon:yes stop_codon:yes gene_type:complete